MTSRRPRRIRALAASVIVVVAAGSCALPGSVRGSREVSATFDDVGDLVVGHSVQVADVRIGSIAAIELTEDYRAEVTMSIKDDVFVPTESRAILRTTSLLGEKFIELRPLDQTNPTAGTDVEDGHEFAQTGEAPELEFVAEEAVEVLGAVVVGDVATLVETGSVGFGGRQAELTRVVENLSVISATLADQTDEIVRIIDALGGASETIADNRSTISTLLVDLADASTVLAENRQAAIDAIEDLTRLARVQNELVFEPYLADLDRQITQLDAILAEVVRDHDRIRQALHWLAQFTVKVPLAIPDDFAQVYALFEDVVEATP